MLAAELTKHVREEKVLKQTELNAMALREVIRHFVDNLFMELLCAKQSAFGHLVVVQVQSTKLDFF